MRGELLIIRAGRGVELIRTLEAVPELGELHTAVGGYIELVPHFECIEVAGVWHRCVAFCDEDGKRKGARLNQRATALWDADLRRQGIRTGAHPDYLVGDVVIVVGDRELLAAL